MVSWTHISCLSLHKLASVNDLRIKDGYRNSNFVYKNLGRVTVIENRTHN